MKRILLIRLCLVAVSIFATITVHAQDPYTVLSNDDTVLTFYYDNNLH